MFYPVDTARSVEFGLDMTALNLTGDMILDMADWRRHVSVVEVECHDF